MDDVKRWVTTGLGRVHVNPWFSVRKDNFLGPDGNPGVYYVAEKVSAAIIIPEHEDGTLTVTTQMRYPVGKVLYDFPAGMVDPGEDPGQTALRELREETGYVATDCVPIGSFYTSPGLTTERAYVFVARGLSMGMASPDEMEDIAVFRFTRSEIERLTSESDVSGFILSSLYLYDRWKSGSES